MYAIRSYYVDLYYWPTPNGWKISVALEEMGLPYTLKLVNIGKGEQFTPEFLALSPNNRMPAIVDHEGPDGAPISIFESGAILQYLARKTGMFYGETERDRIAVDQWLFWQVGGLGPMAGQAHHFLKYAPNMDPPNDVPYAKNRYRKEVARLYGVMDRQLRITSYNVCYTKLLRRASAATPTSQPPSERMRSATSSSVARCPGRSTTTRAAS